MANHPNHFVNVNRIKPPKTTQVANHPNHFLVPSSYFCLEFSTLAEYARAVLRKA